MREGPLAALFRKTEADGLEAPPEQDAPSDQPRIPTPQERLRHAFSSDIPDDVLQAPTPVPERPRDPYARSSAERDLYGPALPAGQPIIRVVGVGGAGVNAINRMVEAQVNGVEFISLNTDLQSLQQSDAHTTLHIGSDATRGLGSGSNPDLGRQAAMEDYDKIKAALRGSDMVFITAGSGGGTGTGAAPIVARIARELETLTVGIVTKPFGFEGSRRMQQAERGVEALADEVDTLIVGSIAGPRWSRPSASPTTCCARASRGSPT
jgi:cell division protein FtsZ